MKKKLLLLLLFTFGLFLALIAFTKETISEKMPTTFHGKRFKRAGGEEEQHTSDEEMHEMASNFHVDYSDRGTDYIGRIIAGGYGIQSGSSSNVHLQDNPSLLYGDYINLPEIHTGRHGIQSGGSSNTHLFNLPSPPNHGGSIGLPVAQSGDHGIQSGSSSSAHLQDNHSLLYGDYINLPVTQTGGYGLQSGGSSNTHLFNIASSDHGESINLPVQKTGGHGIQSAGGSGSLFNPPSPPDHGGSIGLSVAQITTGDHGIQSGSSSSAHLQDNPSLLYRDYINLPIAQTGGYGMQSGGSSNTHLFNIASSDHGESINLPVPQTGDHGIQSAGGSSSTHLFNTPSSVHAQFISSPVTRITAGAHGIQSAGGSGSLFNLPSPPDHGGSIGLSVAQSHGIQLGGSSRAKLQNNPSFVYRDYTSLPVAQTGDHSIQSGGSSNTHLFNIASYDHGQLIDSSVKHRSKEAHTKAKHRKSESSRRDRISKQFEELKVIIINAFPEQPRRGPAQDITKADIMKLSCTLINALQGELNKQQANARESLDICTRFIQECENVLHTRHFKFQPFATASHNHFSFSSPQIGNYVERALLDVDKVLLLLSNSNFEGKLKMNEEKLKLNEENTNYISNITSEWKRRGKEEAGFSLLRSMNPRCNSKTTTEVILRDTKEYIVEMQALLEHGKRVYVEKINAFHAHINVIEKGCEGWPGLPPKPSLHEHLNIEMHVQQQQFVEGPLPSMPSLIDTPLIDDREYKRLKGGLGILTILQVVELAIRTTLYAKYGYQGAQTSLLIGGNILLQDYLYGNYAKDLSCFLMFKATELTMQHYVESIQNTKTEAATILMEINVEVVRELKNAENELFSHKEATSNTKNIASGSSQSGSSSNVLENFLDFGNKLGKLRADALVSIEVHLQENKAQIFDPIRNLLFYYHIYRRVSKIADFELSTDDADDQMIGKMWSNAKGFFELTISELQTEIDNLLFPMEIEQKMAQRKEHCSTFFPYLFT